MAFESQDPQQWYDRELKPHEPALRRFLRAQVPAGVEIDDIVQETYYRIFKLKAAGKVRSSKGLFFSIGRNVLRDKYRSKYAGRDEFLVDLDAVSDMSDENRAADALASRDEIQYLIKAIQRLPKRCREIFRMRNQEQLSYREIASRLDISVKTVETQLGIAAEKCRKYLKSRGLR